MSDQRYEVVSTGPTTYNDPVLGIVNGVLVRVRLTDYNEVHDLRFPSLDAVKVKAGIDALLKQRDELAGVSPSKSK